VDLTSVNIMQRTAKKDIFKFLCRESVGILERGTRHKVLHEENTVYILIDNKKQLGAYAFIEGEYPSSRIIY